ncbi:MAG TPA: ATP-binding protein, partial [Firmicutes bacterium]|nr:ATP-binding protein [Bacillota bacterium]
EHYEKLGVFYLGRPYDLEAKKPGEGLLLYDSKDLVTHGVCVGMTGSGKTGLCIALLEEAALDNIPAIVIDPKGDLTNMLLTFPELRPEDFRPWINEDDARKKGLAPDEYAAKQAELWRNGLASWHQDGERIRYLKNAADFVIYTPGSTAGIPVSILDSFAAPPPAIVRDLELLQDRVSGTASSLLGLIGVTADPINSREHILISNILSRAWQNGQDLDLAGLIQQIQNPPFSQVGVMNLESFFPSKERFNLSTQLNNLLASPSFAGWLQGESLDIDSLLHNPTGKPKISIFSIAHLSDNERMFFVSLLLNQVLSWTRSQSGTTSLRALLYMDEIFGFFPPVANPPSKAPLLTLLKQARAYGVGVMLTTQNPVDLDYKGLANTGTWFVGRLQTERDKNRLIDGLAGATAAQGIKFDRREMEQVISGLGQRVFLMNNVHQDAPTIFETRWCMSYLRGPLTRNQIKLLMDPRRAEPAVQAGAGPAERAEAPAATPPDNARPEPLPSTAVPFSQAAPSAPQSTAGPGHQAVSEAGAPVLPPSINQAFVPLRSRPAQGESIIYRPMALGAAQVGFINDRINLRKSREMLLATPITDDVFPVDWDQAQILDFDISELETRPVGGAVYEDLPASAGDSRNYTKWSREFVDWLYRTQTVDLLQSKTFNQISEPGESERDFRIRLQQKAREQRDEAVEKLRKKYSTRIATLEDRVRRAEQTVKSKEEQAKQYKMQTAISIGSTVLGSFLGKTLSTSTLGRATTAARGAGRAMKGQEDVKSAMESLEVQRQKLQELEEEFKRETELLSASMDPLTEELEQFTVKPYKKDILLKTFALAWLPYRRTAAGIVEPAWQ